MLTKNMIHDAIFTFFHLTVRHPIHIQKNGSITYEGVHLILPRHIFSVQIKSGACYITGQCVVSSE